jgi:hypothetical protein
MEQKDYAADDRYDARRSNYDKNGGDTYPVDEGLGGSDYIYLEEPGLGGDDSPKIGNDSDSEFG